MRLYSSLIISIRPYHVHLSVVDQSFVMLRVLSRKQARENLENLERVFVYISRIDVDKEWSLGCVDTRRVQPGWNTNGKSVSGFLFDRRINLSLEGQLE